MDSQDTIELGVKVNLYDAEARIKSMREEFEQLKVSFSETPQVADALNLGIERALDTTTLLVRKISEAKHNNATDDAMFNNDLAAGLSELDAMRALFSSNGVFSAQAAKNMFAGLSTEVQQQLNKETAQIATIIKNQFHKLKSSSVSGMAQEIIKSADMESFFFDKNRGNAITSSDVYEKYIRALLPNIMPTFKTAEYSRQRYGTANIRSGANFKAEELLPASFRQSFNNKKYTDLVFQDNGGTLQTYQRNVIRDLVMQNDAAARAAAATKGMTKTGDDGRMSFAYDITPQMLNEFRQHLFNDFANRASGSASRRIDVFTDVFDLTQDEERRMVNRMMSGSAARALSAMDVIDKIGSNGHWTSSFKQTDNKYEQLQHEAKKSLEQYEIAKYAFEDLFGGSSKHSRVSISESPNTRMLGMQGHHNEFTDKVILISNDGYDEKNENHQKFIENVLSHKAVEIPGTGKKYVMQNMHGTGEHSVIRMVEEQAYNEVMKRESEWAKKHGFIDDKGNGTNFWNDFVADNFDFGSISDLRKHYDATGKGWSPGWKMNSNFGKSFNDKKFAIIDLSDQDLKKKFADGLGWFADGILPINDAQVRLGTAGKGTLHGLKGFKTLGEWAVATGLANSDGRFIINGPRGEIDLTDYAGMVDKSMIKNMQAYSNFKTGEDLNKGFTAMLQRYGGSIMADYEDAETRAGGIGSQAMAFIGLSKSMQEEQMKEYGRRMRLLDTEAGRREYLLSDPDNYIGKMLRSGRIKTNDKMIDIWAEGEKESLRERIGRGEWIDFGAQPSVVNQMISKTPVASLLDNILGKNRKGFDNQKDMLKAVQTAYKNKTGKTIDEETLAGIFALNKGQIVDFSHPEEDLVSIIRSPSLFGNFVSGKNYAKQAKDLYEAFGLSTNGVFISEADMKTLGGADYDGDRVKTIYGRIAQAVKESIDIQNAMMELVGPVSGPVIKEGDIKDQKTFVDNARDARLTFEASTRMTQAMGAAARAGVNATMFDLSKPENRDMLIAAYQSAPVYEAVTAAAKDATEAQITNNMKTALYEGPSWSKLPTKYSRFFNTTGTDNVEKPSDDDIFETTINGKNVKINLRELRDAEIDKINFRSIENSMDVGTMRTLMSDTFAGTDNTRQLALLQALDEKIGYGNAGEKTKALMQNLRKMKVFDVTSPKLLSAEEYDMLDHMVADAEKEIEEEAFQLAQGGDIVLPDGSKTTYRGYVQKKKNEYGVSAGRHFLQRGIHDVNMRAAYGNEAESVAPEFYRDATGSYEFDNKPARVMFQKEKAEQQIEQNNTEIKKIEERIQRRQEDINKIKENIEQEDASETTSSAAKTLESELNKRNIQIDERVKNGLARYMTSNEMKYYADPAATTPEALLEKLAPPKAPEEFKKAILDRIKSTTEKVQNGLLIPRLIPDEDENVESLLKAYDEHVDEYEKRQKSYSENPELSRLENENTVDRQKLNDLQTSNTTEQSKIDDAYKYIKAHERYNSLLTEAGEVEGSLYSNIISKENKLKEIPQAELYYKRNFSNANRVYKVLDEFMKSEDFEQMDGSEKQRIKELVGGKNDIMNMVERDFANTTELKAKQLQDRLSKTNRKRSGKAEALSVAFEQYDEDIASIEGFRDRLQKNLQENSYSDEDRKQFEKQLASTQGFLTQAKNETFKLKESSLSDELNKISSVVINDPFQSLKQGADEAKKNVSELTDMLTKVYKDQGMNDDEIKKKIDPYKQLNKQIDENTKFQKENISIQQKSHVKEILGTYSADIDNYELSRQKSFLDFRKEQSRIKRKFDKGEFLTNDERLLLNTTFGEYNRRYDERHLNTDQFLTGEDAVRRKAQTNIDYANQIIRRIQRSNLTKREKENRIQTIKDRFGEDYVDKEVLAYQEQLRQREEQTKLRGQQEINQAARAEMQAEQMNRNWRTRTLTDPFTRNYLQRRSMYDQYRGQAMNFRLQKQQAEEMRTAAANAKKTTTDPKELARLDTQYKQASEAVTHWSNALNEAEEDMREFGDENGNFNEAFQMTAATIETVSTAADKLIQNFGRQVLRNAFNEAKNFVVQFDSQMRSIQAITMKTDEQMQSVKQATVDRAIELRTSVANVAQVEADLYRQGLNDEQVEERSDAIIKFATVTGAKVGDAGKAITTAIQNGLVDSAEEAMDVMTALGDSAATTANEIFKGMQKSAAAAKVAGVSYDELTTLLTIGTSKTQLSGNVIGTGLQTIFSRMNRVTNEGYANDENGNTTTINDVEKALKSAGVQLRTEDGRSFRGSFDVLRDLSRVWSGLSDIQRSNVTYTMAGGRQTNMFTTLMEGMSEDGGAWLDELLGLAEGSEGTTENKYAIAAKSITASLEELKSTYDGIVENLTGNGVITSGIDMVTSLVSGFKDLTDSAPAAVAGIGLIGTAIAGLFAKIASGLKLANMASGPAGLISTLIALVAGGTVFGGFSLAGDIIKSNKEMNDPEFQQQKKEEEANDIRQLQQRRLTPVKNQIDEVKKLGEAWDAAGKKMGTAEAVDLQNALTKLNQQMTGLTGSFKENGDAIENWRNLIKDAEETVGEYDEKSAQYVDDVKVEGYRLKANNIYKDYNRAKELRQLGYDESTFGQFAFTAVETPLRGKMMAEVNRLTQQEYDTVKDLGKAYKKGEYNPLENGFNEDFLKDVDFTSEDKFYDTLAPAANRAAAIDYFGLLLQGRKPLEEEEKTIADLWERFYKSDSLGSYLLAAGFNKDIFKEGTKDLNTKLLGGLSVEDRTKLYDAMINFQRNGAGNEAAFGELEFRNSATELVKAAIADSSQLNRIFGGNATWLTRAAEQAAKNINPADYKDADALTSAIIKERDRLIERYKGASNELVNSEINAADYQRQIKYRNKKGELVEFGTNDIASNAQMLADLHEASVQAETSDIQANTSAVQQAGTQAAQAGANAKAGGEAFKAGVDALAEQNKDKESEPVEVKIDLTINKDGEISTSVDGEDKNTSGNAFNAPSGAIVVANNMASDVRHGITFKPEWMDQLGDLQNEPDIEKALGSLIQLATSDPDFAKYMRQFADPLREITEKANEHKAQMDAEAERQRKLKLQKDLSEEEEEEASFFEASPGVQAELERQRKLKLQKELNEKEEEVSFFEASPGVQAELDRQRRLKLQKDLNEKEEEASFFEPKANVQAAIDQSKEKELERLRTAVQKEQEEKEKEINWFDESKVGVQETLDIDPRAAAEQTIKEARAYYKNYGRKNDNPDPIADLYYDENYGGEKVEKLIEALRVVYDTKELSKYMILSAFGLTVEDDKIQPQSETPNVLSQYATDNNWNTSYSGIYSQLLEFAKQSTTWDELIKNIGKTNIPDLNKALTNDKNVLGALQGFYSGDISQQELVDTLQTAFLGSTIRDQGRNLMSSTFSYEQQAAALDAVRNGTASSEQYDMIASQYGIDRNRLQNNIGLFTAMESRRLSAERGNIEFKANDYFNDLFGERLTSEDALKELEHGSTGLDFDSLIDISPEEKQLIDSARAAGFSFAVDQSGRITTIYNGKPYQQEDVFNPYEWNRNLGRSQARADIMEYLANGELSGNDVKQRLQNMENYSSEVAQYIALTDEARKSTEGLALLEQIRIKVKVDGLDDLVALGQMSQEAVTWATQLATGGTMKFDARRAIRASTLETSQLGGLANATELTPEMRQAMMQYLNVDETTFNTKDWTEWQKELREELSSVEFRESLQNDFLKAYVAAFESGDQTSMDRIKNSISALGGKLIDNGTVQSVIFGDNWFKNIGYQASTTLKDTTKYFDPATLKNYRNDLYNGTLTDIEDEDVQKALRDRYGNDIDILANQERYTARQVEIAKNNTDLVDQLESYKELTQLGELPDNAESLAQSLFGQNPVGRNQAQAQIRQEAASIQELADAFNTPPSERTVEQWQQLQNLLGVGSRGEVNEAEANKAIQDQLDVWMTFLDKIAESNPEMKTFTDNVKTMLGGGDIGKIDLKTNLLDTHEVQLSTTSLLEYVDQLVAAGEAGEEMFGNLPKNIQQQLINFGGLADFMKTYGENTAEAAKAQRDLTLSIVTGTLEALEQEGKIISGISGQMETLLFGNDVDRKKQTNQMIDQITEYANVREAYDRLISGDRTRQEDWDTFQGFWNISDRRLQEYQLGRRSLIEDYGKEMESVTDLQQETAKNAVETILRAEAGENGYIYDYSDIPYVAEMQRRGQAPKVKARQKTLEEMVSEMSSDQIADFNRDFSDFGVFINENGQLQTTAIADQQLTLGQILQRNLMMRDRIVGNKGRESDAETMLNLFDTLGGNKDSLARAIDLYQWNSSAIKELMNNEDFIEALDKGDRSTARQMIANIGGRTLPNQTRMADARQYIEAALSGESGKAKLKELSSNSDMLNYLKGIEGFEELYNMIISGEGSIEKYMTDALRSSAVSQALYERERNGELVEGTSQWASLIAKGTDSNGYYTRAQKDAFYQVADQYQNTRQAAQLAEDMAANTSKITEIDWAYLQQKANMTDKEIEEYKKDPSKLQSAADELKSRNEQIRQSIVEGIKEIFNLGDLSDLNQAGKENVKALVESLLSFSGLELKENEDGTVDVETEEDTRTAMDILENRAAATYGKTYETKSAKNLLASKAINANTLEEFEAAVNEDAELLELLRNPEVAAAVLGDNYDEFINNAATGRWNWDRVQNSLIQGSSYAPLYHDQMLDNNIAIGQSLLGSGFGTSSDIGATSEMQRNFYDFVSSPENAQWVEWIKGFEGGAALIQSAVGPVENFAKGLKSMNAEITASKINQMNKYGKNTAEIAGYVKDLNGNATDSAKALGTLLSRASKLGQQGRAAQNAKGKSGKTLDKDTKSIFGSFFGLDENALKQMSEQEISKLADIMEQAAKEEFESSIGATIGEQLISDINKSLEGKEITLQDVLKFDVNADGVIDASEAAAAAQELQDTALAELASYAGTIGELVLKITESGNKVTAEAILNSFKGGKTGGGGGGGGGGKSAAQKLMEEIKREQTLRNHEIKMIQYQETKYENAGEIGNQNRMIELENVAQQKLIKTLEDAISKTKQQMAQTKKGSDDWYSLYESVLTYEEGIEEANQAIADNTRKIKENEQAILKLHTDLEQAVDQEIRNRIQMQRDMLDGTVSMEDIVLEAIRQRYRDEWALIQKDIEKKKAALEEEKNLIDERLQRRKDAEDEAEKYEELAEYKRQLALISLDSTRTKDAAKLREQIANLEKEQAWNIAQDEADYQKEQINEQIQAYDDFVTYGDEDLEEFLANANNMADEVNGVMQLSQEGMMDWLKDNVKEYALAMDDAQKQMIQGWTDTYEQMLGITHTYWDEIAQILSGKDTWLAYMQQSQEYIDASTDERAQMLYEWGDMYDKWLLARKNDAIYSHTDDQLSGTGSSGKGGGGGGNKNKTAEPKASPISLDGYKNALIEDREFHFVDRPEKEREDIVNVNKGMILAGVNKETGAIGINPLLGPLSKEFVQMASDAAKLEETFADVATAAYKKAHEKGAKYNHDDLTFDTFDGGGLVDYTGPAWVDGTKTKPEAFLDAEDTALIRGFLDQAQYVRYRSTVSNIDSNSFGGNSQNIGEVIVNITEAQFKDDADFDEVAHRVGQQFVKEISKQGFNTMSYSF